MERTDHIVLVGGQGNDGYEQAGDLFRLMTPPEKKALIGNLAGHVNGVPQRFAKLQI